MHMIYLDFASDFMDIFARAFYAKSIMEKIAPGQEITIWTTAAEIEIDAANKLIFIDGEFLVRYDVLWIGNLAKFISSEITYKYQDPTRLLSDLKKYQWIIDNQDIDLFLVPGQDFPKVPGRI